MLTRAKADDAPSAQSCLNCGRPITDETFCPQCGQKTATQRLTTKNFIVEVFMGLLRVNKGFVFTAVQLLIHPWEVIRNYINGKRVKYSGPIQTLLVICFLLVILGYLNNEEQVSIETITGISWLEDPSMRYLKKTLTAFLTNPALPYLLLFIPALPVLRLVYKNYGARRYNTAEYLLAGLYMSDSFLCCELVTYPLEYISSDIATAVSFFYFTALAIISIVKAFHSRTKTIGRTIFLLISCILLSVAFYLMLLLSIGIIVACSLQKF